MDQVPPYCNQYHHCQVYLSEEVEKSGWLYKQGGSFGQWRKRWFVQSNNYLFYFKSREDSEPRGSIPLEEVEVVPQAQDGDGKGIFLVHHKDNFSYYLKSEDGPEDIDDWVESIKWAKYSALKAGYFRLDDINAKLKEQLRKETERANELKEECDQLRRAGGGAGGSGPHHDGEIQQLRDQLRQAQRERDQAQRELAAGGGMGADPDVFEPTRSDFRVLVYRERYDESSIMGELIVRPDCTFQQVRQIIAEDLGQLDPFKLVHGHLGDPLGRSGNLLGPELDSRAIQEVFHDHDGEMLIVQPDTGGGSQRYSQSIADLDTEPAQLGASSTVAPPTATIFVPVYWMSNDPSNRKGEVPVYDTDTVGDIRARIATEGLSGGTGQAFNMKRRKVPMMPRKDGELARNFFADASDYIIVHP